MSLQSRFQTSTPKLDVNAYSVIIKNNFTLPTTPDILSTPVKSIGSMVYDRTSNIAYTSNGSEWMPISGGGGPGVTTFSAGLTGLTPSIAASGTVTLGGVLSRANGGTGVSTGNPSNGQILIGNGLGYTLSTLSPGPGIAVSNGVGSITITNLGVSSFSGGTTGLTPNVLSTGSITLAGVLSRANGGTGVSTGTPTNGQILIGNGTGYALGTLTAGSGITITNGPGTITISSSGSTSQTTGTFTPSIKNFDISVYAPVITSNGVYVQTGRNNISTITYTAEEGTFSLLPSNGNFSGLQTQPSAQFIAPILYHHLPNAINGMLINTQTTNTSCTAVYQFNDGGEFYMTFGVQDRIETKRYDGSLSAYPGYMWADVGSWPGSGSTYASFTEFFSGGTRYLIAGANSYSGALGNVAMFQYTGLGAWTYYPPGFVATPLSSIFFPPVIFTIGATQYMVIHNIQSVLPLQVFLVAYSWNGTSWTLVTNYATGITGGQSSTLGTFEISGVRYVINFRGQGWTFNGTTFTPAIPPIVDTDYVLNTFQVNGQTYLVISGTTDVYTYTLSGTTWINRTVSSLPGGARSSLIKFIQGNVYLIVNNDGTSTCTILLFIPSSTTWVICYSFSPLFSPSDSQISLEYRSQDPDQNYGFLSLGSIDDPIVSNYGFVFTKSRDVVLFDSQGIGYISSSASDVTKAIMTLSYETI